MKKKVSQQVKPKVILGIVQCLFTTWCNQKKCILCCNTPVKSPRLGKKIISIWHLLPGSGVGGQLPPVWPFVDSLPSQGKWYLDWEPKKERSFFLGAWQQETSGRVSNYSGRWKFWLTIKTAPLDGTWYWRHSWGRRQEIQRWNAGWKCVN